MLSTVQSACCETGDAVLGGLVFRAGLLLPILQPMQIDTLNFERLQTFMTVCFRRHTLCTGRQHCMAVGALVSEVDHVLRGIQRSG